ncbi:MAG: alpha/beta hydrolase [Proteobacteria bacterium]|nr:alpha/beta hydrolase [Pseudomonadota bacterium]MBU1716594.1 alpha/beta hydrolase [Pseudomonadota bacterium]
MSDQSINQYVKLDHPAVLRGLFHPFREKRGLPPAGSTDHDIKVAEGVMVGGRFHLAADVNGPHILFFHGNGEVVGDYDTIAPQYTALGLSFLAVDYRGYGWSDGEPTASNMMADAHAILVYVKEWLAAQGRDGSLLVMGRSLGSASAIELAVSEDSGIGGLIIESGFANTMPLLQNLGVDVAGLGLVEEDGFGNKMKIARYTKPVFILHASNDEIIPVAEATELHAECAARSKELQTVPGAGHNNIIERGGKIYFEVIKGFTRKIGAPARRRRSGIRNN